ncbi:hypothetical protein ACO0RG_003859 [Hanseniaspora osmophila]
MSNSLQERLQNNANSFEGLLSLIPAKFYYDDEDNNNQWKAKKQSKKQKNANKRMKLSSGIENDGDSSDDDDEEEEEEEEGADGESLEGEEQKQKVNILKTGSVKDIMDATEKKPAVIPGMKVKKLQEQQQQQQELQDGENGSEEEVLEQVVVVGDEPSDQNDGISNGDNSMMKDIIFDDEGNEMTQDFKKQQAQQGKKHQLKNTDSKEKKQKLDKLRSALQQKIQSLKEKRKAPGSSAQGAPVSREAILEQRKRKQELSQKKKLEADDESESASDSDSDNSSGDSSDDEQDYVDHDINADNVMFQNIQFSDGSKITSDLQRVRTIKKKGPANKDIKGHLKMLERKKQKLENKDELELIKLKEKEKWNKVMLHAEGVKLKDNEKLLKKSLKRKENQKKKSAVEWRERKQMVVTGLAERQKRREENLQIRKENKGKKRKDRTKFKKTLRGKKAGSIKRAGFEGKIKRK